VGFPHLERTEVVPVLFFFIFRIYYSAISAKPAPSAASSDDVLGL